MDSESAACMGQAGASPARIDALVRLLGDDDPHIRTVAWQNLERIGGCAVPQLERALRDQADSSVQVQCARFLKEWTRRQVLGDWSRFCGESPRCLERGVFLIARSEYPDIDVSAFSGVLDQYTAALAPRLLGVSSVDESVRRVSAFLFGDVGFRGNAKEYYDPENSYINRVLERRLGIPITLATVFLLVARRLDLPVYGVGLPQHFILKFRGKDGEVFMDPFGGGKFLGVKDCARYLSEKHVPFLDAYLRAVTDGEILTRMLGNLLRIYIARDDQSRCDRVSGMLKALV